MKNSYSKGIPHSGYLAKDGYYITSDGRKYQIREKNTISVCGMNITELVIPVSTKEVYCSLNQLTELDLPDKVVFLDCEHNNLTELIIPSSVEWIDCNHNNLTKLDLPDSVQFINCRNNRLTELIIPDDCNVLCDPDVRVITRTMFNRSNRLKNLLK